MPYIKVERRRQLDAAIESLIEALQLSEPTDKRDFDGDLNYTFSKILLGTLNLVDSPKYSTFNTAIGVLDCVKLELYRRFAAPYEELKIKENGDII